MRLDRINDINRLARLGSSGGGSAPDPIGDAMRAIVQAYYKGDNTTDSGPNGHTLTNNGGATFTAGKIGNAFTLNGSQNLTASVTVSGARGVDFWFTPATGWNGGDYAILSIDGGEPGNPMWLLNHGGVASHVRLYHGGNYRTSSELAIGTPYHIALSFDGTTVKMWLNATEILSSAIADTNSPATTLRIGTGFNGSTVGQVDEFGLYDDAITQEMVDYRYASGAGISLYP